MDCMSLELWDFSWGDLVKDILKAITDGALLAVTISICPLLQRAHLELVTP